MTYLDVGNTVYINWRMVDNTFCWLRGTCLETEWSIRPFLILSWTDRKSVV